MPLGLMVLTFVLPMTTTCGGEVVSPVTFAVGSLGAAFWILPTYIAGALLTIGALRGRAGRWTGAAMTILTTSLPVLAVLFLHDGWSHVPAVYATAGVGAAALLVRALRRSGPERLRGLLDAYAVAALPLAMAILAEAQFAGAYLFGFAYAAFATQRAFLAAQRWHAGRDVRRQHQRLRVADAPSATRVAVGETLEEEEPPSEPAIATFRPRTR